MRGSGTAGGPSPRPPRGRHRPGPLRARRPGWWRSSSATACTSTSASPAGDQRADPEGDRGVGGGTSLYCMAGAPAAVRVWEGLHPLADRVDHRVGSGSRSRRASSRSRLCRIRGRGRGVVLMVGRNPARTLPDVRCSRHADPPTVVRAELLRRGPVWATLFRPDQLSLPIALRTRRKTSDLLKLLEEAGAVTAEVRRRAVRALPGHTADEATEEAARVFDTDVGKTPPGLGDPPIRRPSRTTGRPCRIRPSSRWPGRRGELCREDVHRAHDPAPRREHGRPLLLVGGLWLLYRTELFATMRHQPLLHGVVHAHMLAAGRVHLRRVPARSGAPSLECRRTRCHLAGRRLRARGAPQPAPNRD
ncbi:hypothetical protein SUDANB51_06679 [Streptomyces sp. enrichment culture]